MSGVWKRLQVFCLAFMLVVLGSAGVFAQDSAPNTDLEGELLLWHGWTGAEADTLTNDILPAWQAANPNVTIEVLAVPFDQLKNKYSQEVATGGGPDLLIGPADWVGELATGELIRPLDDLVDEATLGNYLSSTVDALRYDGNLYGLPESFEAVAMYYNKQLMPEPAATTADLDAAAAEINAGAADTYGLALLANFYHPAGYFFGFGSQLFDENNQSTVNSPETVAFLNWMNGLQSKPGYFLQNDDNAISSLFKEGKAAAVFNGPWALGDYVQALGAENVGVAPMPVISEAGDAATRPFLGVKHIMMNADLDDDQAALAAEFMKWFTGPESAGLLVEKAGHLPAHVGVDVSGNEIAQAFVTQAETATPMPIIPEMGQVWEPVGNMITAVLSGASTAEDAAATAQDQINEGIQNMGS
ncbi:MAG: extracellular solute-binding protein [Thermomicrobiales bacterium]|nr:extracellular solute-binding protein [Thermomicrobiales bacterium]